MNSQELKAAGEAVELVTRFNEDNFPKYKFQTNNIIMAELNAIEMKGIADLLGFLEKWDGDEHEELYAQVVLKRSAVGFEEPDEDIGIITFSKDGYYTFKGMNVDLRGIVKKQHNCRNCGTAVEVYAEKKEEADEEYDNAPVASDGFGNVVKPLDDTKYTFRFSEGGAATTVQEHKNDDQGIGNAYNPNGFGNHE